MAGPKEVYLGNNKMNISLSIIPLPSSLGIDIQLLPGDFILDHTDGEFGSDGDFYLKISNKGNAVGEFSFHADLGLLVGWNYSFHENEYPSRTFQKRAFNYQFPELVILHIFMNRSESKNAFRNGNTSIVITARSVIYPEVNDSLSFYVEVRIDDPENDTDDSGLLPDIPPTAGAVVGMVSAVSLVALIGIHEPTRFSLFAFLAPLYTRLQKDDLETLENRKEILGFIKGRPGTNYSAIMHELGIGNGCLTYHLKVLESNSVIRSRVDGNKKRFYPKGYQIIEKRERILELLETSPGLAQKDIVRILRMGRRKAGRKLSELVGSGKVRIEKVGRENHYFLTSQRTENAGTEPRTLTKEET